MKVFKFFLVICFFCITESYGQEIATLIEELEEKVDQTEGRERLIWMDSLSNVIAYDTNFESDSIVRATVDYARQLDSADIAVWHSANLIFYYNNVRGNLEVSRDIILKTGPLIPKVSKPKVLCKYFYEVGNVHFRLGEFEASLSYYDSTAQYAKKAGNNRFIGLSKMAKGQLYADTGDFGNASLILQDAVRFAQEIQDTSSMVEARNSLTILYSKNGFFEEAAAERKELIQLEQVRRSLDNIPALYINAAADYNKQGDQKKRIANLDLALETAQKSRFSGFYTPIMLSALVEAQAENDSIDLATQYMSKIDQGVADGSFQITRGFYLVGAKALAFTMKDYPKALELGKEYLSLKGSEKQSEEMEYGELFLYNVYMAMGEKEKALEHYVNYSTIKDSIKSSKNVGVLAYYQTLYETEKRDLKIQAQQSDIALLDEKNKLKNQWLFFGAMGLLSVFGFVVLTRSRNEARKRQQQQLEFTTQLVNTQEMERSRVAKELHDSVGQKLLILKNTFFSKRKTAEEELVLLDDTIKEVREMSHDLHPFQFEKLGLVKSLADMMNSFQKSSEVFYTSEIEEVSGLLPKDKEIVVFRMLQEGISNVEKHAQASACKLSVKREKDMILFQLKDNGVGFDTNVNSNNIGGLGLRSLYERAQYINADLSINSEADKGTLMEIKIPTI